MESSLTYEAKGNMLVIHLPRELDHHNYRNLKYEAGLLPSENYMAKIVFDFSATDFMDSSGIGMILNRYKQMEASGGKMSIYGAGARTLRVLSIGGISRLVPQCDTKEATITGWDQKVKRNEHGKQERTTRSED